jgi:ACS family glucarate transporter-like MFS transporter
LTRPTHVRYSIVALGAAINLLCYTDRVVISIAGPRIQQDLGLAPVRMGLIYGVFSLAYALAQTPWGMLADRFGARLPVTGAILCWSGFTALTGAASGFVSMLGIRFAFGSLEAALSPSTASGFARWIPAHERSTAFGAFLSGGRLGAAVTPPLAVAAMLRFGWRLTFALFGSLGIVAAAVWLLWYRDEPVEHPRVNAGELKIIPRRAQQPLEARPRWRELRRSRSLRNLLAVSFAITFQWQFFITWFPTYLMEQRGMDIRQVSYYSSLPFLLGFAATWIGGFGTDFLARRFDVPRARLWVGCVGLGLTGFCMLLGVLMPFAHASALLMAFAAGAADLYLGAVWSSATDIGGASAGAVCGLVNATSNCAAFASPALMGWALQAGRHWNTVLFAGILTTFVGAFLWSRMDHTAIRKGQLD